MLSFNMEYDLDRILSLVSFFSTQTNFCGRTKLAKILFYCDWRHLKETGRTITGLTYLTYKFGPLPQSLNDALKDKTSDLGKHISYNPESEGFKKPMIVRASFNKKIFTPFELQILDEAVFIFKDVKREDMIKASHWIDQPWTKTRNGRDVVIPIDEKMAFSDADAKITYEEYQDRKKDFEDVREMVCATR